MTISIRRKRRLIALCYHFGVVAIVVVVAKIGMVADNTLLINMAAVVLLSHLFTFRIIPVSRWIQKRLISEAICLSCGAVIDLVGLYRCGCGFLSHKERHVFSPCPMCGKTFSWINCPECETSIPI